MLTFTDQVLFENKTSQDLTLSRLQGIINHRINLKPRRDFPLVSS